MGIHIGSRALRPHKGRQAALTVVLAMVALASLAGCGGSTHVTAKLTASFAEPPNTPPYYIFPLTPLTNYNGYNDGEFQYLMYRPLYWFGVNGTPAANPALSLADAPTYTDGGRTAVVRLKPYKWSDGQAISSRDVVFWMNLLRVAKNNWAGYVPGEFPDNLTSVKAQGPDTVAFTFNRAYNHNWLLYNELSQITPMPQHAWDKTSAAGPVGDLDMTPAGAKKVYNFLLKQGNDLASYVSNPLWKVVSGPWKVSSFDTTNHVTLVPNAGYSGPIKPVLKQFNLVPFTSDTAEYNVLRGGGIDFGYIPPQDATQIPQLKSRGFNVTNAPSWSINFTVLNYNNPKVGPLFKQLYIRQAMQQLIDQGSWVKAALNGFGTATNGPVPVNPPNPFISPLVKQGVYAYSPQGAEALLKQHGWTVKPNGVSTCASPGSAPTQCGPGVARGAGLDLTLEYANGVSSLSLGIQATQSNFSQAGIKLNLVPETSNTVNAHEVRCTSSQSKCGWQMVQGIPVAWTFQPDYYPEGSLLFSSSGASNSGGYSDSAADQLITATHVSTNSQAITAYEDYLARQLPDLWTPVPNLVNAVSNKFTDTQPNDPLGNLYPEQWRPAH